MPRLTNTLVTTTAGLARRARGVIRDLAAGARAVPVSAGVIVLVTVDRSTVLTRTVLAHVFVVVRVARAECIHTRRTVTLVRLAAAARITAGVVLTDIALIAVFRTCVLAYTVPVPAVIGLVEGQTAAVAATTGPGARCIRPRRLTR